MINKTIVTEKFLKELQENDNLELGNKGEFILLESKMGSKNGKNYRFGKLEKLAEGNKKDLHVEFSEGKSYNLYSESIFGVNIPIFKRVYNSFGNGHQGTYFKLQIVKEFVVGKENIVNYLSKYEKYKPHAEAIGGLE